MRGLILLALVAAVVRTAMIIKNTYFGKSMC